MGVTTNSKAAIHCWVVAALVLVSALSTSFVNGAVSLLPPFVSVCSGETIQWMCTANESSEQWWLIAAPDSPNGLGSHIRADQAGHVQSTFFALGSVFNLSRTSVSPLVSTLTTAAFESPNGTTVECSTTDGTTQISVVTITSPPSPPQGSITSVQFEVDNATAILALMSEASGVSYHIRVDPPPLGKSVSNSTNQVQLTVSYNTQHTVYIVASNCAGNSSEVSIDIYYADCGDPATASGVLANYSATLEGSKVTFSCRVGLLPNITVTAICQEDGEWSPNPANHKCTDPLKGCGPPSPPSGGSVGSYASTEEGANVTFQCNIMTAVCQANGEWLPNPAEALCTQATTTGKTLEDLSTVWKVVLAACGAACFGCGMLCMCAIMTIARRCSCPKAKCAKQGEQPTRPTKQSQPAEQSTQPTQPTWPAGPQYEDVVPRDKREQNIELKENVAYGQ